MAETIKCSTVLVSEGNRLRAYGSVDEVPVEIRRRFLEPSDRLRTATILIADQKGREELERAARIQGVTGFDAQPRAWIRWVEGGILCAFAAAVWALLSLR
jgi:hypothetical protein